MSQWRLSRFVPWTGNSVLDEGRSHDTGSERRETSPSLSYLRFIKRGLGGESCRTPRILVQSYMKTNLTVSTTVTRRIRTDCVRSGPSDYSVLHGPVSGRRVYIPTVRSPNRHRSSFLVRPPFVRNLFVFPFRFHSRFRPSFGSTHLSPTRVTGPPVLLTVISCPSYLTILSPLTERRDQHSRVSPYKI